METDPQTISAYLVYLSQHAPVEEQGQHNDLALVRRRGAGAERLGGIPDMLNSLPMAVVGM